MTGVPEEQPPVAAAPEENRARWGRRGRQLGAGALVLAALAVGRVVEDRLPSAGPVGQQPFERHVAVGEAAHLRIGDVTVTEVQGSKAWAGVAEAKLTPGLWVIAHVELVPSRRDSGISDVRVRSSDERTWSMGRGESTCKGGVAGVPMRCQVIVEIPEEPIPDAELVLRWTDLDDRWDDQAVVPLTISPTEVAAWAKVTDPVDIPNATVGPAKGEDR